MSSGIIWLDIQTLIIMNGNIRHWDTRLLRRYFIRRMSRENEHKGVRRK
jgi:hypothetical protein